MKLIRPMTPIEMVIITKANIGPWELVTMTLFSLASTIPIRKMSVALVSEK